MTHFTSLPISLCLAGHCREMTVPTLVPLPWMILWVPRAGSGMGVHWVWERPEAERESWWSAGDCVYQIQNCVASAKHAFITQLTKNFFFYLQKKFVFTEMIKGLRIQKQRNNNSGWTVRGSTADEIQLGVGQTLHSYQRWTAVGLYNAERQNTVPPLPRSSLVLRLIEF